MMWRARRASSRRQQVRPPTQSAGVGGHFFASTLVRAGGLLAAGRRGGACRAGARASCRSGRRGRGSRRLCAVGRRVPGLRSGGSVADLRARQRGGRPRLLRRRRAVPAWGGFRPRAPSRSPSGPPLVWSRWTPATGPARAGASRSPGPFRGRRRPPVSPAPSNVGSGGASGWARNVSLGVAVKRRTGVGASPPVCVSVPRLRSATPGRLACGQGHAPRLDPLSPECNPAFDDSCIGISCAYAAPGPLHHRCKGENAGVGAREAHGP